MYTYCKGMKFIIITVWVDDLLLFSNNHSLMEQTKIELGNEWELTNLGEPSKIIRIEITRTLMMIKVGQQKYIENILKRQEMDCANPISTLLDPNKKLQPNPDRNKGSKSNSFVRLLGELQYIANVTQPDIAYLVNQLASYTANTSMEYQSMLKRILRCLAGIRNQGITY
jgi:hypothetical protein